MGFSYSGNPASSDLDAVRFEIQDTNSDAQLLQDAEVEWAVLNETGVAATSPATITEATLYLPAARCCSVISRRFLAQADTQVGQLKITSTKRAAQYEEMAAGFRLKAQSFFAPYSGGQSRTEKENFATDADAIKPSFTRREFDSPFTGSQDGLGLGDVNDSDD